MQVLIDTPKDGFCHMVADTIPNLHAFAQRVGINKCWFQNKRGKGQPHYDVRAFMLKRCVDMGAKQVQRRDLLSFLKQHYNI